MSAAATSPAGYTPEVDGIEFGEVHAKVRGDLSEADLLEAVKAAASMQRQSTWWLGDLLAYGERVSTYEALAAASGYHPASLRRMSSVSKRVSPAVREPGLHWRHHREVAAIADAEEQRSWLALALAKELTSDELARTIRQASEESDELEDPVGDAHQCPHCHGTGVLKGGES